MDLSMLPDFIVEAAEHLDEMETCLLQLEQDQENKDILNDIFRSIHSIKGAAQYIGLDRVSELSHRLESLLDLIRQGKKALNQDTIDMLIDAKDRIQLLVNELDQRQVEESEVADLIERIDNNLESSPPQDEEVIVPEEAVEDPEITADSEESDEDFAREMALLKNECLEEEYDEKLLAVFMQNLRENLVFLQLQIVDLASTPEKVEVLERCSEVIKRLSASSYYMGYDLLCDYYKAWGDEIDLSRQGLSSGDEPGLDFMQLYLDEIVRVYPQTIFDLENEEAVGGEGEVGSSEGDFNSLSGEFHEETEGLEGQESEFPRIVNESLEDEHEEELLDIFIQNLQENIGFLHNQIAGLEASSNKEEIISGCRDSVKSLYSSAKYMDYKMLCQHCEAWLDRIISAVDDMAEGNEIGLDFMKDYHDEIKRVYPEVIVEERQREIEEEADAEEVENHLDETLDSLFSESEDHEETEPEESSHEFPSLDEAEQPSAGGLDTPGEISVPDMDIPELENESLDEEYDEELLAIFIQQLQENIGQLQNQIDEFDDSDDQGDILDECSDTIKVLRASANYMGYDILCDYYTAWLGAIDNSEQTSLSGVEMDLGFMQNYLDEVYRVYPKAVVGLEQKGDELSVPAAVSDDVVSEAHEVFTQSVDQGVDDFLPDSVTAGAEEEDETIDNVASTIGALLSSPADIDEFDHPQEQEIEADVREAYPVSAPETDITSTDTVTSQEGLFGKLNSALELDFGEIKNTVDRPMHNVIEEMISPAGVKIEEEQPGVIETVMEEDKPPVMAGESGKVIEITGEKEEAVVGQRQEVETVQRQVDQLRQKKEEGEATALKKVKQSMRVDVDKIDYLMNQVGELVVSRAYFSQLFGEIKTLQQELLDKLGLTKSALKPLNEFSFRLGEAGVALGRVSNEMQEAVMKVRMLPISQLFKRYPRLVRDLVRKSSKQVKLEVKGEDTELDKMVIEEISDPLIHIIRNAVDHGIETVRERRRLGKPATGTLLLEAYHESNHIVIEITDDGKGIDPEHLMDKALAKGLYNQEELERMPLQDLNRIIMLPGFSTADRATETSGRGVGMDVVKKNIDKLNGTIDIASVVGQETKFIIKIPLTLAIIQALMVRVDRETFTIPLTAVEETLRVRQQEISEIEGVEVIHLRDSTMPIFRLSKIFNMKKQTTRTPGDKFFVVVVSTGLHAVGLVVDELLGQEEVVIKPLADYLRGGSGFSGATIIGDGAISLILDVPELVKMTTERQVLKQKDLALRWRKKGAGLAEQQNYTVQ